MIPQTASGGRGDGKAGHVNLRSELMARGLSPKTASLYVGAVRRAEQWCDARGYDLATAPADVVLEYVHSLTPSFATRKLVKYALRHFWAVGGRPDPLALKLPPKPVMVCRALGEDDASLLARAAAARTDEAGMAVLVGLYLALRRHEIARLRRQDFRPGWGEVYVVGKGGVSAWLPVHPWLAGRLRAWQWRSSWLFPSDRSGTGHVCDATVWTWTRQVARDAGLGYLTTHQLRHTSLAHALDATRDLRAVQRFARHADPEVTAGYTRATGERLQAVVLSLDFVGRPLRVAGIGGRDPAPAENEGGRLRAA